MLGNWQVHLKGKVDFNLEYRLHIFQIQFHLKIEIAISNLKLQLKFTCIGYTLHDILIQFQLQLEIAISNCNWNWMLGNWQVHLRESGF